MVDSTQAVPILRLLRRLAARDAASRWDATVTLMKIMKVAFLNESWSSSNQALLRDVVSSLKSCARTSDTVFQPFIAIGIPNFIESCISL
jgi:hypothetical protein